MPSPVAHSLAGVACAAIARYILASPGQSWSRPESGSVRRLSYTVFALALIGAASAPDLDFVPGVLIGRPDWLHRGPSHSLLAAVMFGAVAYAVARVSWRRHAATFGLFMGVAYASHILLDIFSPDPLRFNGVPAFWPLSGRHFVVPTGIFLDIRRDPAAGGFLASLWHLHNLHAVVRELLIMGGLLALGRIALSTRLAQKTSAPPPVRPRLERRLDSES